MKRHLSIAATCILIFLFSSAQTSEPVVSTAGLERALMHSPLMRQLAFDLASSLDESPVLKRSFLKSLAPGADTFPQGDLAQSHTLTFPHTANGRQAGVQVIANVFAFNNSGLPVEGTIRIRKSNGDPFSVNTNLGSGSQFPFTLGRGEILRLRTDGEGPVETGWVEITSNMPLSGSRTFEVVDGSGNILSEVGIGDSPRSTKFMLFVDTRDGKSTAWAVANPNSSGTADLRLELRQLNGLLAASRNVALAAGRQINEFVSQTFSSQNLTNFRGILVICSDGPEISVTTLRTRGVRFTSFPAAPLVTDTSDDGTLLLPRIGDGIFGAFSLGTTVIILNNSEADATISLQVFGVGGAAQEMTLNGTRDSTFDLAVPAGTAVELVSDATTNPGVVAWIGAESDIPIFGGAAFTTRLTDGGEIVSEVGVPASGTSDLTSVYTEVRDGVDTGIGVTNVSPTTVTARIRLISNGGQQTASRKFSPAAVSSSPSLLAETRLDIPPLGHVGLFASQLFSDVPEIQSRTFEGRMEILSFLGDEVGTSPLVSTLTLRSRGALLTSMPVAPRVVNFAPDLEFYASTSQTGATPEAGFDIFQLLGDRGVASTVVTLDRGTVQFDQIENADPIGYVIVDQITYLFATLFATNVTADSAEIFATTVIGDSLIQLITGTLENLGGGGVRFEVFANPTLLAGSATLFWNTRTRLRLIPGLLKLPATTDPISIQAVCTAFPEEGEEGEDPIQANASKVFSMTNNSPGPLVHQIDSFRFAAGQEILIRGSGFSASPASNRVVLATAEGEQELNVLASSATTIQARLPDQASSGLLQVEVGDNSSNPYRVELIFSPQFEVTSFALSSPSGTSGTAGLGLQIETSQRLHETLMDRFTIGDSSLNLRTTGFSPGANVGQFTFEYLGAGTDEILSQAVFDLLVDSSDAQKLVLKAVDPDDDEQEVQAWVTLRSDGFVQFDFVDQGGANTRVFAESRGRVRVEEPVVEDPIPDELTRGAVPQFDLDNVRGSAGRFRSSHVQKIESRSQSARADRRNGGQR